MQRSPRNPAETDPFSWNTWWGATWIVVTGRTRRPALRIALVVGTLLSVVNQTGTVIHAAVSAESALRIAANYAIPYVVASVGFLSAHRRAREGSP